MPEQALQKSLFSQWKNSSNEEALDELLSLIKPSLHDYLLRMTGRANDSLTAFYEIRSKLYANGAQHYHSFTQLRIEIYKEARNTLNEYWNEDTSALENLGLLDIINDENKTIPEIDTAKQMQKVERLLTQLASPIKESAVLNGIQRFSVDEVALITSLDVPVIVKHISSITQQLKNKFHKPSFTYQNLSGLLLHPLPEEEETMQVTDLQELMVGIKKKVPTSFKRITFLVFLVLAGALGYVWWMDDGKTLIIMYHSLTKSLFELMKP